MLGQYIVLRIQLERLPVTIGIQQLIDGTWRDGTGPLVESVNPAKPDEVVARGAAAELADVDLAVKAAVATDADP